MRGVRFEVLEVSGGWFGREEVGFFRVGGRVGYRFLFFCFFLVVNFFEGWGIGW